MFILTSISGGHMETIVARLEAAGFKRSEAASEAIRNIFIEIAKGEKPYIVFEGEKEGSLHRRLMSACLYGLFTEINSTQLCVDSQLIKPENIVLVVGDFDEQYLERLKKKTECVVFVGGGSEHHQGNFIDIDPKLFMSILFEIFIGGSKDKS